MGGVVPFNPRVVCGKLGMRAPKLTEIIDYFADLEKVVRSPKGKHIWVVSGAKWSLYGGNASERQLKAVSNAWKQASKRDVMGEDFATSAAQLYAAQYQIHIPIVSTKHTHSLLSISKSESKSKTQSESESRKDVDNFSEKKKPDRPWGPLVQDEIDSLIKQLQNSPLWHAVPIIAPDHWLHGLLQQYQFPDSAPQPHHVAQSIEGMIKHWREKNLPPLKPGEEKRIEGFIAKHNQTKAVSGFKRIGDV
jgi:hypothetical protein